MKVLGIQLHHQEVARDGTITYRSRNGHESLVTLYVFPTGGVSIVVRSWAMRRCSRVSHELHVGGESIPAAVHELEAAIVDAAFLHALVQAEAARETSPSFPSEVFPC